jgi:hypothetical protein
MSVQEHTPLIIGESDKEYHAKADNFLSSHALADFRKCPMLYRKKRMGLIEDEDRPAYLLGRALHTLVLEGRSKFEAEYAVGGPVNPKTGELFGSQTKAWAEWAEMQGRPVLTLIQFDLIENMAEGVKAHGLAAELLSEGVPEAVLRTTYHDIPCQIRMDWFDPHRSLVDLKTCDDLTWFESDAKRYGYIYQLAFYRAIVMHVLGIPMPVHLIAIEKKEPFRCGVWLIPPFSLDQAQKENDAAIERLKRCQLAGIWPSGYEECRVFDTV